MKRYEVIVMVRNNTGDHTVCQDMLNMEDIQALCKYEDDLYEKERAERDRADRYEAWERTLKEIVGMEGELVE